MEHDMLGKKDKWHFFGQNGTEIWDKMAYFNKRMRK